MSDKVIDFWEKKIEKEKEDSDKVYDEFHDNIKQYFREKMTPEEQRKYYKAYRNISKLIGEMKDNSLLEDE